MAMTDGGRTREGVDDLDKALRAPLLKVFPAAFLGRVVTIPYYPLSDAMIEAIANAPSRQDPPPAHAPATRPSW